MMNQLILVGRLAKEPIEVLGDGTECAQITLAVSRPYKNRYGIYGTDFIDCMLYKNIANGTLDYLRKGDLVGIRGRLETLNNKLVVKTDKITFLSSRKEVNDNE